MNGSFSLHTGAVFQIRGCSHGQRKVFVSFLRFLYLPRQRHLLCVPVSVSSGVSICARMSLFCIMSLPVCFFAVSVCMCVRACVQCMCLCVCV